ncbi:ABC transporter permease [Arsenicicoccus piscis]|uniref:ABC transporter permease n=1 Tax=Arsenicicoccus piscis TaxID=673954 RepID=A0ABQ6HKN6_9MICO|nr:ABC transporter permease [Arsenicicoccus piscis]MCH8627089.1 ABC transporter permease [Arsenicicoccus piscis]GMA18970.1 ABC transporter permease [Arsenicicoccus piscis]
MVLPSSSLVTVSSTGDVVRLVLVVALLTAGAAVIHHLGRLGHTGATVTAAVRATLQLAAVGLIITAVLKSWWLTAAFVALMVTVAALTSGRRVLPDRWTSLTFLPILLGIVPVGAILLASQLIPLQPIAVVPILGILIGNAMTATTIAGRRTLDALRSRRGELEAALSIGLLDRDAAMLVARDDAALALVPGLDQTRTVGLVTLPGAFVGTLLGGATPLEAAAVQLVVLAALLMVQAVAVAVMLELVARGLIGAYGRE